MRPRRRRLPRLRWTVPVLLLLLVLLGALTAWQAYSAFTHLQTASARAPQLGEEVLAGDDPAVRSTVATVQRDARTARDAVDGWQWQVLARLPVLGDDVQALQGVTEASDSLARGPLTDLADVTKVLRADRLLQAKGRIALGPIRQSQPTLAKAARSAELTDRRLQAIDTSGLFGWLRDPIESTITKVGDASSAIGAADRAARLLPSALGGEGPRTYLLLVQNNAEPRALGGLAGSVIQLRADDGRIRLVRQRPGASFPPAAKPVLRLSQGERTLYGTQLGRFMVNASGTPDFPRAAQLARASWARDTGQQVDGVASIDPVALGSLLQATGPIALPHGGKLTSYNTARTLINTIYSTILAPEAQDAYFSTVSAAIFDRFTTGRIKVPVAIEVLGQATRQGRLMFWSDRPAEQRLLSGTAIAGELVGKRGTSPVVGVYLHDKTQGKIAYYEDMDVKVHPSACRPDGSQSLGVTVTLTSHVPEDVGRLRGQTGGGVVVPVGQIASQVFVYAPTGGKITGFTSDSTSKGVTVATHDGLDVLAKEVILRPGQSVFLDYDIESPSALPGPVVVRHTPGPEIGRFGVSASPCER